MEVIIVGSLIVAVICAILGRYVSSQKHRSPSEGALLGFALGPLGVIVAALLPTVEPPKKKPARRLSRSGWLAPPDESDEDQAARWVRGA